jgi:hypothetical protein
MGSVGLVAPSIARGSSRFIVEEAGAIQKAASPTPSWATISSPLADEMQDGRAEGGGVEGERFARVLNPQLRLDARHRRFPHWKYCR